MPGLGAHFNIVSYSDFCTAVEADLSNWDDNGAWPLLFDEYVSWRRESS
jgi:hypothetical protein